MISLPTNTILGTLGPKKSFHDILRNKYYPGANVAYLSSFEEIFDALANTNIHYAIVAISNSIQGDITENIQKISELKLHTVRTHDLPISLHLAARSSISRTAISKVYAHPVAMSECRAFFKNLNITHVPSKSNAQALIDLKRAQDDYAAAISGKEAIALYDMMTIEENIHDSEPNITTFALITKNE